MITWLQESLFQHHMLSFCSLIRLSFARLLLTLLFELLV